MEKRNTVQKKFVLDAVTKLTDHPTAELVYAEVVNIHPNISKATVYRNLAGLAEDGIIRQIKTPNGADRFDYNALMPHNHITCIKCGAFCDAPMLETHKLNDEVSTQTGYKSVSHEIVYSGICQNCAKKTN